MDLPKALPPKAGQWQKKAFRDATEPCNIVVKSKKAQSLVHDWSWGLISGVQVQKYAHTCSAFKDIGYQGL